MGRQRRAAPGEAGEVGVVGSPLSPSGVCSCPEWPAWARVQAEAEPRWRPNLGLPFPMGSQVLGKRANVSF